MSGRHSGSDDASPRTVSDRPVSIRPVEPDDFDRWLPLWAGYQRFYEVDIPGSVTSKTWDRLLDPAEPMHGALAIVGGRALGVAHWLYHRSTWTIGDYCYLQDLFVDSDARGFGVGRRLVDFVTADARRRGAARVHWLTHETNSDAMKLYDRIADRPGFVQYRKLIE